MGVWDLVEAKRDMSMQLYLPHDVTNVLHYFYDSRNKPGYKQHCSRILKYYYESATSQVESFSTFDEDSDHDHAADDSESARGNDTSRQALIAMHKTPKKVARVDQDIRKPIFHEYEDVKVEIHEVYYDADDQRVTVVAEADQGHSLLRTPVRLSNSFNHVWGFKFQAFPQPRPMIGVQHERVRDMDQL